MKEKISLVPIAMVGRSLLDYLVTQGFFICDPSLIEQRGRIIGQLTKMGYQFIQTHPKETHLYFIFLQAFGFLVSGAYGILKKDFREAMNSIPLTGLGTFLAENFYFVWVSLLGDLNRCYGWYTGNPLNPDGNFGYSWTNPANMLQYFLQTMGLYLGVWGTLRLVDYFIRGIRER
ncbi:MAG: hypothetical protein QXY45_00820 [Candidatus Aenigmatarchaeota archaeon]